MYAIVSAQTRCVHFVMRFRERCFLLCCLFCHGRLAASSGNWRTCGIQLSGKKIVFKRSWFFSLDYLRAKSGQKWQKNDINVRNEHKKENKKCCRRWSIDGAGVSSPDWKLVNGSRSSEPSNGLIRQSNRVDEVKEKWEKESFFYIVTGRP